MFDSIFNTPLKMVVYFRCVFRQESETVLPKSNFNEKTSALILREKIVHLVLLACKRNFISYYLHFCSLCAVNFLFMHDSKFAPLFLFLLTRIWSPVFDL